jgi:hypothetical protein
MKEITVYENKESDGISRLAELEILLDGAESVVGKTIVCEGPLEKVTRHGGEKYHFILMRDCIIYCKSSIIPGNTKLKHHRTIPLNTMILV